MSLPTEREYVASVMGQVVEGESNEALMVLMSERFEERVSAIGDEVLNHQFKNLRNAHRNKYERLVCVDRIKELLAAFESTEGVEKWQTWLQILSWTSACSDDQLEELRRERRLDIRSTVQQCLIWVYNEERRLFDEIGWRGLAAAKRWEELADLAESLAERTEFGDLEFDRSNWNRNVIDKLPSPEIMDFADTPEDDITAHDFRMLACRVLARGDRGELAMLLTRHAETHGDIETLVPPHVLDELYSALTRSLRKQHRSQE